MRMYGQIDYGSIFDLMTTNDPISTHWVLFVLLILNELLAFSPSSSTVKPVLSGHPKIDKNKGLKDKW